MLETTLDVTLGALTFSMMGCCTLLASMVADRKRPTSKGLDREPEVFTWARVNPTTREIEAVGTFTVEVESLPVVEPVDAPIVVKAKRTRAKRSKRHVQTPSEHMTLSQLEVIRADNYVGKGFEYDAESVDRLIVYRSQQRADKMVSDAIKRLDPISAIDY